MKTNCILTDEIKVDGYGRHRVFKCEDKLGKMLNNGYNTFSPYKPGYLIARELPESIDLTGSYDGLPCMGWVYVNFTNKTEKIFVDFKKQGNVFVSIIVG